MKRKSQGSGTPRETASSKTARLPKKSAPSRKPPLFLPLAIGMSGGVILSTAAFWFFKQQAENVVEGRADRYDTKILEVIHSAQSPNIDRAMRVATTLGSHTAIGGSAVVTALVMIRRRRPHDAWTVLISTGGAMVLNTVLKAIFQRQRPQELHRLIKLPKSHSFPSGHSLLAAATYPIVVHHLVERLPVRGQVAALLATAGLIGSVGYSRVYFAVHFPSDVLAGFTAGLGWLGLTSLSHTLMDRDMTARERRRLARLEREIDLDEQEPPSGV